MQTHMHVEYMPCHKHQTRRKNNVSEIGMAETPPPVASQKKYKKVVFEQLCSLTKLRSLQRWLRYMSTDFFLNWREGGVESVFLYI